MPINHQIRPVIFLGLGSTGSKIVSRIFENIQLNSDVQSEVKPFYRYLGIVSETKREPGVHQNLDIFHMATAGLTPSTVLRNLKINPNTKEYLEKGWHKKESGEFWAPSLSMEEGTGAYRALGSLLLSSRSCNSNDNLKVKLESLRTQLADARDALPHDDQDNVNLERCDCYIFGLLAGGTCSGAIVNTSLIIRAALGASTNLFGNFLLGDVCRQGTTDGATLHMQHCSTCFALAELSIILSQTGHDRIMKEWPRYIGNIELPEEVFEAPVLNSATMIGAENEVGRSFSFGGKERFERAQGFVADFYTSFFKSIAVNSVIGRAVDNNARDDQAGAAHPARPGRFNRIGYASVQLPRDKVVATLSELVADEVGRALFQEPPGVGQAETFFLTQMRWGLLSNETDSPFAPSNRPAVDEEYTCPSTATDFRSDWTAAFEGAKQYFAASANGTDPQADASYKKFEEDWRSTLRQLTLDLGGQSGNIMRLGSLHSLIDVHLIPLVSAQITSCDDELVKVQDILNTRSREFSANLDAFATSLPNKFNVVGRKFWSGGAAMTDALKSYCDAMHKYALLTLQRTALSPLLRELQVMSAARKLVAAAQGQVYETIRAKKQSLFSVKDTERIYIEVLSDETEIRASLVEPMLGKPAQAGAPGVATLKDQAVQQIAAVWAGAPGHTGVFAYFEGLCETLRRESGNLDAALLSRRAPYSMTLERLRSQMTTQFEKEILGAFASELDQLSVWDVLGQYVQQKHVQTKESTETMLLRMFATYGARAALFTRTNGLQDAELSDKTQRETLQYMCNSADAVACFERLEIKNPQDFLDRLMSAACPGERTLLDSAEDRDKIQIFHKRMGELPIFYSEYAKGLQALLANPPVTQTGEDIQWTDARFPQWITQWRTVPPVPKWL